VFLCYFLELKDVGTADPVVCVVDVLNTVLASRGDCVSCDVDEPEVDLGSGITG